MSKAGYFAALAFTVLGAGVTGWFASKWYYDKKAQKVIETGRDPIREEVKEPEKTDESDKKEVGTIPPFRSPEEKLAHYNSVKSIYAQALEKHNYTVPEEDRDMADQAPIEKSDEPYIIDQLDWGQPNGYDKIDLVYYKKDGIIADYEDNIISSEEVGDEFKERFDENDVDIVHVRNDSYSRDYEIVLDPRSYREAVTGE